MPYIKVTNIDLDTSKRPESNWLYAILEGYNRKAIEVTNWLKPVPIIDSNKYGIYVQNAGAYTFFRKLKSDGRTYYQNHLVDCQVSQNIVFATGLILPPQDGFNFRVSIQLIEMGNNPLKNFEYGYTLIGGAGAEITNWQNINTFDLINEGIYYFDVRIKNTSTTVGKQSIELILNNTYEPITGGEDGDNPMPGTNSGE
jgi:hypothetical protein